MSNSRNLPQEKGNTAKIMHAAWEEDSPLQTQACHSISLSEFFTAVNHMQNQNQTESEQSKISYLIYLAKNI